MALSSVPTITIYERELAELDRRRARLLRRIAALRPPPENPWAQEQMLRQMTRDSDLKEPF